MVRSDGSPRRQNHLTGLGEHGLIPSYGISSRVAEQHPSDPAIRIRIVSYDGRRLAVDLAARVADGSPRASAISGDALVVSWARSGCRAAPARPPGAGSHSGQQPEHGSDC